ncbi:uncharacterized protein LOC112573966 isoform X2 [Pomacea canaliculata]|uniref:uncharacterized protein LOC112573966 isoform X2 n=1 Tax=Pomacea canaliculata TaxID=400727 RepID=UPI000D73F5EA|nr:uncharacterized protein LOC112573966 isoform X2 [Pomacea canaliculata]
MSSLCCWATRAMKSDTSEREEKIRWDKSRLHNEKLRNGHPPASSPSSRKVSGTSAATTSAGPKSSAGGHRSSHSGGQRSHERELRTSFDPMKDLHMWTMWRTAVNGRIMDEVRKKSEHPSHQYPHLHQQADSTPYGSALVRTPLNRFIRMGDSSQNLATMMMDPHQQGNGHLQTTQFVFYGVPRVVLKKPKRP